MAYKKKSNDRSRGKKKKKSKQRKLSLAKRRRKTMGFNYRTRINDQLRKALEESVKLQAHYATLLNAWDGGERKAFVDADEWIARLVETGTIK